MKISLNWLADFVKLDLGPEELAEKLLLLGFEVAEIVKTGPEFTGVVVGEVLKAEKHPGADKLKVCDVTDGTAVYPVVCGAPNAAAGQKVAFAKTGARLKGGLKIKKSKIRGALSEGMICSDAELGLAAESDGIKVLPADSPVGADFRALAGGGDTVFEVEIMPNRPDCLSHFGLARELAIHFGLPAPKLAGARVAEDGPESFPVSVADPAECPRYTGRLISGVKVGPSPKWLVDRLEAVGLRPINSVADVTNFVLMETGQPLHAFDADALRGSRLAVRDARDGEPLEALDGKSYRLTPGNLVIADAERAVAVAGVIGGTATAVTEKTTRVLLECAHFRPERVRRSGAISGIRTDSSFRFERGSDPGIIPEAGARAAALIVELAGGKAGPPTDTLPAPPTPPPVRTTAARMNEILGTSYPAEDIERVLKGLAAGFVKTGEEASVVPPSWRGDLATPWDLAEEVARHLGYDAIPDEAGPVRLLEPETPPLDALRARLGAALCGLGFHEAYNYDFVSLKEMSAYLGAPPADGDFPAMLNPISEDWTYLRPTLLVGLLRNAALNLNRGAPGLRLFEFGRTYSNAHGKASSVVETHRAAGIAVGRFPARPHWKTPSSELDFYGIKGVVEALLGGGRALWREPERDGVFHPKAHLTLWAAGKPAGKAGLLHPELVRRFDVGGRRTPAVAAFELDLGPLLQAGPKAAKFVPYSVFPSSSRDLSLLVPDEASFSAVEGLAKRLKRDEIQSVELVDVFAGEGIEPGKKSWTLRLGLSRPDRTLKDAEINEAVSAALKAVERDCGAVLRK